MPLVPSPGREAYARIAEGPMSQRPDLSLTLRVAHARFFVCATRFFVTRLRYNVLCLVNQTFRRDYEPKRAGGVL